MNFIIVHGPEVIGWPPLVEYAADLVAGGAPVFLSAHGKLSYVLGMMRLNDRLISAAQSHDTQRVRRELATAIAACLAYPGLAKSEEECSRRRGTALAGINLHHNGFDQVDCRTARGKAATIDAPAIVRHRPAPATARQGPGAERGGHACG